MNLGIGLGLGFSTAPASGGGAPALGYPAVLLLFGDSQARGSQDDPSTGGYVANSRVKIRNVAGAWVDYNPGVSGASGIHAGSDDAAYGAELQFAKDFLAARTNPADILYIHKESRSGGFQGIGVSTGSYVGSVSGNVHTYTSGSAPINNTIITGAGLINNDGKRIYFPFSGFVSAVDSAVNANVAATGSITITKYDGTASWSSADGLIWNGNSNSRTNGVRARVAASLASLPGYKVIAAGLILGTNDKTNTTTGAAFQAATEQFVARLRSDATLTTTPIVQARVTNSGTAATVVRSAQATIAGADALFRVIDMDGQPLSGDATHWRQAALNYLGSQTFLQAVF